MSTPQRKARFFPLVLAMALALVGMALYLSLFWKTSAHDQVEILSNNPAATHPQASGEHKPPPDWRPRQSPPSSQPLALEEEQEDGNGVIDWSDDKAIAALAKQMILEVYPPDGPFPIDVSAAVPATPISVRNNCSAEHPFGDHYIVPMFTDGLLSGLVVLNQGADNKGAILSARAIGPSFTDESAPHAAVQIHEYPPIGPDEAIDLAVNHLGKEGDIVVDGFTYECFDDSPPPPGHFFWYNIYIDSQLVLVHPINGHVEIPQGGSS